MDFAPGSRGPQTSNQVALVVSNATRIETIILNGCIERWHAPGFQGLRWLDIVVVVDGEMTFAVTNEAPYDYGKALSRYQRGFGAELAQMLCHKFGHFLHSPVLRRDTGLAAEALQGGHCCVFMRFDPGQDRFNTFSRSRNRHIT